MFKRLSFTLVVIAVLAAIVMPFASVSAQEETRTVEITEDQVNSSFRVTNPWRRSLSNISVDLQDGQAAVSGTYTRRAGSVNFVATYVPSVENGDIFWTLVDLQVDGAAVPQSTLDALNNSLARELRRTVKEYYEFVTVTDIQIGGDVATITYIPRRGVN